MTQPVVGFDWDNGNWPKCAKHGVSKAEIEEVFHTEPMVRADRRWHGEPRFNAIGRTRACRYIFIAFAIRTVAGQRMIRPISARYMHQKEILYYEQSKSP